MMDIEKYKKQNDLSSDEIIHLLRHEYPKFSHAALSMVKKKTYGVVLAPKAVRLLDAAFPMKKPKRKKAHQLTVRVDDRLFGMIERFCEKHKITTQDLAERAIFGYIDSSETIIEVLNNICKVEEI